MSEFAQSAYDADTIKGEEGKRPDLVEVPIDPTTEGERKPTPEHKHFQRPAGPCDNFSPMAVIRRPTGVKSSPSGSDSTNGSPRQESQSPNRNRFEALSQDNEDEEEDEVVADAVLSIVMDDAQNGPPDIVRSHPRESADDLPAPNDGEAQELPQPVHQDETKGQEEQDFHEADLN